MNSSLKKTGTIVIIILMIVSIFFVYREFASLNENEKIVEEIYSDQLETILTSINGKIEDVVSDYNNVLGSAFIKNQTLANKDIQTLLSNNKSISSIFFADSTGNIINSFGTNKTDFNTAELKKIFLKLKEYSKNNYYKIEPIAADSNDILLVKLLPLSVGNIFTGITIHPDIFINDIISAQLELLISEQYRNRLLISVSKKDSIVFASGITPAKNVDFNKQIWLLPGYNLGITFIGKTFESLINERVYINLILILLLIISLAVGGFFIYNNIKKELELAQIKNEFVANVSHELRTPLALITMFSETLEMNRVKSEERKQEYYRIISQETNRLSKIVNKILNFSKIEAGKKTFNLDYVNLNECACDIYNNYQYHLQNKGFKFTFTPDDDIPFIYADKEAVTETIINLIDNAVKYSEDVKEVLMTTSYDDNFVNLEVSDKGIGISEDNQKRVFDKFFRVSSNLVHNTKGTGLGLSIVKYIMEYHQGDISVKSKLWEGSTFKLSFPINFNKEKLS